MKLTLTDKEAVDLLRILNDRVRRCDALRIMNECRFTENANRLASKHESEVSKAENLITKIAKQL